MISEQEVFEYREIYYEYFKPNLNGRFGMPKEEAERVIAPALIKFGWSYEKYTAFCAIDLAQRLSKTKSDSFLNGKELKVEVRFGNYTPNSLSLSLLPELKCPRRTTQIN